MKIHQDDRLLIERIIAKALVCRVAASVDDRPYLVPLSFGYDGKAFYFHTAPAGKKIDYWRGNPRICFELEGDVQIKEADKACEWTMLYESVIGYGVISEITDPLEKEAALKEIMRHYSEKSEWQFEAAQTAKARLWKLTVEKMTAKSNRIISHAVGSSVS
ncbi:MAG: pyridoxamine 5'-phosphate oxidase family protein [candidate division KSB1 bacterium]|nr:pyridoxamine 5'-phosphate oxidase family protein [candidate division KSB1 bacterium]